MKFKPINMFNQNYVTCTHAKVISEQFQLILGYLSIEHAFENFC